MSALSAYGEELRIKGKVVGVHDGDTLTLLTESKQTLKIRLGEIDAPELKQPYGQDAKKELSNLVFSKQVEILQTDTDRYKRIVGKVYFGRSDINLEMVKRGAAWVYRDYSDSPVYIAAEEIARKSHAGFWKLQADQITPPWQWRKSERSKSQPVVPNSTSANFNKTCGTKKYCSQMTSCEEAKFFYKICRVTTLDGNRDGVPCKMLCQ